MIFRNLNRFFFRFGTIHAFAGQTDKHKHGRTEFSSLDRVCISRSAVKTVAGTVDILRNERADICFCPDCSPTVAGHTYDGDVSTTVSGRTCQHWKLNYPHKHTYHFGIMYPERSVVMADNKCRNPARYYTEGVWCFTADPNVRWERCDVRPCFGECTVYTSFVV